MSSRSIPARAITVAIAAGLAFSLTTLFSPAPLAFAADEVVTDVAVQDPPAESTPEAPVADSELPPPVAEPPPPRAEPDPMVVSDPPVEPPPPVEVVDPVDPAPPAEPVDPDPATGPEVDPTDPGTEPTPTPEPTTTPPPETPVQPSTPPVPIALPPIPPAPSDQPPNTAWSPGNPNVDEYQGSGDQGVPAVGIDGLIGDNYPMFYKNMPIDPVIWDEWNFAHRQCTSFVSWRLNQVNGVPFDNQYGGLVRWGNAGEWGDSARSLGIKVDKIPAAGAIAYSAPGTNGSGSAGHVAWVAKVLDDGRAVIEEYNAGAVPGRYGARIVPADAFTGYIHLKDLPTVSIPTAAPAEPESLFVTPVLQVGHVREDLPNPYPGILPAACLWVGDLNGDGTPDALTFQRVSFTAPLMSRDRVRLS